MKYYIEKQKKTRKKIMDAYMFLYSKNSFQKITVKKVCDHAQVHRSTFYLHYESIDFLLREIEDFLLSEIEKRSFEIQKVQTRKLFNEMDAREPIYELMDYFIANRGYFIPLLRLQGSEYFKKKINGIVQEFILKFVYGLDIDLGKYKQHIVVFLASGMIDCIYSVIDDNKMDRFELGDLLMERIGVHLKI